ncbi:hypothetical protein PTTG_09308 [Puccinia triticina 1-1 BBBD Race 1]|uniref:SET domain-containing protein n=1 Tax=Puccinia triticina (isolate 1-1 / race 1 (BBBD)) TaxID=630390 RepID=A0A180G626_PUCT1|nr:hypothetical protein PTTG_09308 [Puccinia triticina 1-1 BBBD Race 1]
MTEGTDRTSKQWSELLDWLESEDASTGEFKVAMHSSTDRGRSLVAIEDIEEATKILSLPRSALLDTKTIPKQFIKNHCSELTSTQALTLFLTVYRLNRRTSKDLEKFEYPFSCYLSTLPADISQIPLVWQLRAVLGSLEEIDPSDLAQLDRLRTALTTTNSFTFYQLMTTTTIKQSNDVLSRFINDWANLLPTLRDCYPDARLGELLWSWLIVNTRCVSFPIGAKNSADNIALAPAFDMANHSPVSKVTAVATPQTLTMYSSTPQVNLNARAEPPPSYQSLAAPCQPRFMKGQEITFSYGPHSNSTLLTEYGFVASEPNPWDSIDVTDEIVALFDHSNPTHITKIELLKNTGYWEDYTIQCNPLESSHRILVALRLLHSSEEKISEWQDHIDGLVDELEGEIEQAVQCCLAELFALLKARSRALVESIARPAIDPSSLGLSAYAIMCLKTLASNEMTAVSSYPSETT